MLKISQMELAIDLYNKIRYIDDEISDIDALAAKLVNGQFNVRMIVEDTTPAEATPDATPEPEGDPGNAHFVTNSFVVAMPPPEPNQPGFMPMPQHPFMQMLAGAGFRPVQQSPISIYEFTVSEPGIMTLLQTLLAGKKTERAAYMDELEQLGITI